MQPEWKKFEEAVAAFLGALDPRADVRHNVRLPDKDTGRPRQRDVWIETTYGGHLPIKIHVTCKRESDKLDQQDIDAFVGELRSSGAHLGVLYSYSGYTEPALEKAKALGICCCSLYENSAPDVPQVLRFAAFCFTESARFRIRGDVQGASDLVSDLFNHLVEAEEGKKTSAIQKLVSQHDQNRDAALKAINASIPYPASWQSEVTVFVDGREVTMVLEGGWNIYEAKMDSWLVDGSYSFTNNDFKGSMATPSVDRLGSHPGPGWEAIAAELLPTRKGTLSFILYSSDLVTLLRQQFGAVSLSEVASA